MRGPPILKVGADRRVAGPHAMDLPRRAVAVLPPRADAAALKEADRPNRLPDLLLSGAARARMPSSTYTDAVRKSYFQLPSGMRTALRLLAPIANDGVPAVLPESLVELLPEAQSANSPSSDAQVLISATERLLRALSDAAATVEDMPGAQARLLSQLTASLDALGRLKSRLNNPYEGTEEIRRFVLSIKNELSPKAALIDAVAEKAKAKAKGADQAEMRCQLSLLRLGPLRARAVEAQISTTEIKRLLRVVSPANAAHMNLNSATTQPDIANLVSCPHHLFAELELLQLHRWMHEHVPESQVHQKMKAAWSNWGAKIATVKVRLGAQLWRQCRDRLELVGQTAVFLYAEPGDATLARAYAQPTNALRDLVALVDPELAQREEKMANERSCFVHPTAACRIWWDRLILALLLIVFFLTPLRIGFFLEVEPGGVAFALELAIDIVFILDIFLNFRTGVFSDQGTLISDGRRMACVYLKSWFAVDVLSCLPISYVILIANNGELSSGGANGGANSTKTIKILRLLRLGKLLRLAKTKQLLESQFANVDALLDKLVSIRLLVMLFCFSHYVACFWHFVGFPGDDAADYAPPVDPAGLSWMHGVIVHNDSLSTRYATSLYWASTVIATVGLSDITPTNPAEQYYAVFTQLIAVVVLSYVMGTLASTLISDLFDAQKVERKRKMTMINDYLRQKGFDAVTARTYRMFFLKQFEMKTADEDEVLNMMPPPMRRDAVKFVYKDIVSEILLFRGLNDRVTADMLSQLRPRFVLEHCVIVSEGEPLVEMFLVQSGLCKVTVGGGSQRGGSDLGHLFPGSFFGELQQMAAARPRVTSRTVTAVRDSHISFWTAQSFQHLCQKHPELHMRFVRQLELCKYKEDVALRAEKWSMMIGTPAEAKAAFKRIDTDGGGTLDRNELTAVLTSKSQGFGMELSAAELEDAFAELDENGDGAISLEEFVQGMENLKDPNAAQKRAARVLAARARRRVMAAGHLQEGGSLARPVETGVGPPVLPWSSGLKWHFFLSHKQANGGQTMAWLEGKLASRDVLAWYDNMQVDRSESGMMTGISQSAVFLLFVTEGCLERYFVQSELSHAFRLRKPLMMLYETDDRFGKPDFNSERNAVRHRDREGKYLLSEKQISWIFDEVVGIPVRREFHEVGPLLDELEQHCCNAIEGKQGKAKVPPVEMSVAP